MSLTTRGRLPTDLIGPSRLPSEYDSVRPTLASMGSFVACLWASEFQRPIYAAYLGKQG